MAVFMWKYVNFICHIHSEDLFLRNTVKLLYNPTIIFQYDMFIIFFSFEFIQGAVLLYQLLSIINLYLLLLYPYMLIV